MDDVTLGKLLAEAHRGQADYCEPEGVSVSQSSSSVVFDESRKPDGERIVDQSVGFKLRKWSMDQGNLMEEMVDRSGQLDERNSSKQRLGLYLKNKDR